MVMIRKPGSFGKPYRNNTPDRCPACGQKNCPCFKAGSSMTYKKVNRNLSEKFGVTDPNTGYLKKDFKQLLDRIYRRWPAW